VKGGPDTLRLRIGAVEERTGLTRDTIHFYVREGLVHPPEKTGATVAWFDQSHVERLRAIRALRSAGVPVASVRRLLADPSLATRSAEALAELGAGLAAAGIREVPRAPSCTAEGRALAESLGVAERLAESPSLCDAMNVLAPAIGPATLQALRTALLPTVDSVAVTAAGEASDPRSLRQTFSALEQAIPALWSVGFARAVEARAAEGRAARGGRRAPKR
jgi:DNA-binding transcriptional MerR regulator